MSLLNSVVNAAKQGLLAGTITFLSACGGDGDNSSGGKQKAPGTLRLTAQVVNSATVDFQWQMEDGVSYNLYASTDPNCKFADYSTCSHGSQISDVTSPYTLIGAGNNQSYWFVLEANDNGQKILSNRAGVRPDVMIPDASVSIAAIDPTAGLTYLSGYFRTFGVRSGPGATIDLASGNTAAYPLLEGSYFMPPYVNAVAADGEGGFYVGGSFGSADGQGRGNLMHVLADGSLDPNWKVSVLGEIRSILVSDGLVYFGGDFSSAANTPRRNLAAADRNGNLTDWNPDAGGFVYAMVRMGGAIYMGGSFHTMAGESRVRLAAVDLEGNLLPWAPQADASVFGLMARNELIYAGGNFRNINASPRRFLAAIDHDGQATNWNPAPLGTVYTFLDNGETFFVGGSFTSISNIDRQRLAEYDNSGALTAWAPQFSGPVLSMARNEDTIVIGGDFYWVGDQSRDHITAFDAEGTLLEHWAPRADELVRAVAISGNKVYAGGFFNSLGVELDRNFLAAIDNNGAVSDWNPKVASNTIFEMAAEAGMVYLAGRFTSVDDQPRNGLAAVASNGVLSDLNITKAGDLSAIAVDNGVLYLGGNFTSINDQARSGLAALDALGNLSNWAPQADNTVRDLHVLGNTIYAAGAFTSINTEPRNHLAAIDIDGTLSTWAPDFDNTVEHIASLNDTIYASGTFSMVNGIARNGLAGVSLSGELSPWSPEISGSVKSLYTDLDTIYTGGDLRLNYINENGAVVATSFRGPAINTVVAHNGRVYIGGDFSYIGGLSDGLAYNNLAILDR